MIDGETVVDPFHCNSIDESSTGDLLVSARHLDAVFLVSKATGAIVWKLGGAAYSRDGAELLRLAGDPGFFRQHDARFLSSDSISLFDDETAMTAPARAVAYSLDLARGTATWLWQRPGSAPSAAMGSARLAADGHLLVGWGVLANAHTRVHRVRRRRSRCLRRVVSRRRDHVPCREGVAGIVRAGRAAASRRVGTFSSAPSIHRGSEVFPHAACVVIARAARRVRPASGARRAR